MVPLTCSHTARPPELQVSSGSNTKKLRKFLLINIKEAVRLTLNITCLSEGQGPEFTFEHLHELRIREEEGAFDEILKVGVDPSSHSGVQGNPLPCDDVYVVSHLQQNVSITTHQ